MMSQLTFQNHCSACEATSAQWARVNASANSKREVSTPGKPFPIPPTFGTDSHPYARQIGYTEIMTVPEPEIPQNNVKIQPEYKVVLKKNIDMDYVKELIANIFPPGGSKSEDAVPMHPRPNVPTPPGMPLRHDLSGLALGDSLPSPKPYVPTPPYEHISGAEMDDAFPPPRPYVPPRPPPRTYGLEMDDAFPPPRPYVPPRPPPRTYSSGLEMEGAIPPPRPYVPTPPYENHGSNPEDALPTPRPNVPLPPDAPPTQGLSGSSPEDVLPTPRPNVPLPPDAPPNQSISVSNTEEALSFATI